METNKEFSMPALNVLGGVKAQELINKGEKSLSDNWENVERHPHDPNCIVKYGVKNGEVYGQAMQLDMDEYAELARLKREIERDNPKNHVLLNPYVLQRVIQRQVRKDCYRGSQGYLFRSLA